MSSRTFRSWQTAASALFRTDVGRVVAGAAAGPGEWRPTVAKLWTPEPAGR